MPFPSGELVPRRGIALAAAVLFARPVTLPAQAAPSAAPQPLLSRDGKPIAFEVVSIREDQSWDLRSPVQIGATRDGYRMKGVPLMAVIQIAYVPSQGASRFGPNQVAGIPESLASIRYDIEARVSEADLPQWNNPVSQSAMLGAMLQAMLTDRFKLSVHRETRQVPVYDLTVGKKGPKFKPSAGVSLDEMRQKHPDARTLIHGDGAIAATGPNPGQLWLFGVTMPFLGTFLSTMAGRPIQDRTGLTDKYNLTYQLEFPTAPLENAGTSRPPDFFSSQIEYVVQDQLGLKLSPAEGPMESMIIDQVERPSEN